MATNGRVAQGKALTGNMIKAAGEIHARLSQWKGSDDALRLLRDQLPGHTPGVALIKTVTINGLYGTNVYALVRMAEHVAEVMASHEGRELRENLVEELSAIRPLPGERPRRHTSFASKYAHFFVAEEAFPIYDSLALDMLRRHLGPGVVRLTPETPYLSFCESLRFLRKRDELHLDHNTLDHYLWVAGQYRQWRDGKRKVGNAELIRLFESPPEEVKGHLRALCAED
jgi:hypothetical protein